MKERTFVYEGEAWVRLTLRHRKKDGEYLERQSFVLEVRPDISQGLARWGMVKASDRPRKRNRKRKA